MKLSGAGFLNLNLFAGQLTTFATVLFNCSKF